MNLQIRNPRAYEMAQRLARIENMTMSDAVVVALDARLKQVETRRPLAEVVAELQRELAELSQGRGHDMTKDEIDDMWGQ